METERIDEPREEDPPAEEPFEPRGRPPGVPGRKRRDQGNGPQADAPPLSADGPSIDELIADLGGEMEGQILIYRDHPKSWKGRAVAGHVETINFMDDAGELREYIRSVWGGERFTLQFKRPSRKHNGKMLFWKSCTLKLPGVPLDTGRTILADGYGPPPGSAAQTGFDRRPVQDYGSAGSPGILNVLERSADARAKNAEASADSRVQLLADQVQRLERENRELRDRVANPPERAELVTLKESVRSAERDHEKTLSELRDRHAESVRTMEGAHRAEVDRVREDFRREIDALRDAAGRERTEHVNTVAALRQEASTAAEVARRETRETADREITRLRDDYKDRLAAVEKNYERQIGEWRDRYGELHKETLQLRGQVVERSSPAEKIREAKELVGLAGDLRPEKEERDAFDKVVDALPEIAEAAPHLAALIGSVFGGVMGAAGLGAGAGGGGFGSGPQQGVTQQPEGAGSAAPREPRRRVAKRIQTQAQPATQTPATPVTATQQPQGNAAQQTSPTAPPDDVQRFQMLLRGLERAIEHGIPPATFAEQVAAWLPPEASASLAAQDAAQFSVIIDQATGGQSVVSSFAGRKYLSDALEALRELLRRVAAGVEVTAGATAGEAAVAAALATKAASMPGPDSDPASPSVSIPAPDDDLFG